MNPLSNLLEIIASPSPATGVQLSHQLFGSQEVPPQREVVQSQEQQRALRLPVQRLPAADAGDQTSGLVGLGQSLLLENTPAVSHVQDGETTHTRLTQMYIHTHT